MNYRIARKVLNKHGDKLEMETVRKVLHPLLPREEIRINYTKQQLSRAETRCTRQQANGRKLVASGKKDRNTLRIVAGIRMVGNENL